MGHTIIARQEGQTPGSELLKQINDDKIDLFFWVSTHAWRTDGIEYFLTECRLRRIPSVAYHLDLWMGISRERDLYNRPFFTVDHFFTVDKLMADWLTKNTQCKGHFLPAGVYEKDCVLGTPDKVKYPHDIIFTGSKNYHQEWPYRGQLIQWLHDTYGSRFGHYGPGGMDSVRGPELNNLYASAKVVIGDTLCKNFNYPYYSSDRLFEVTGRGGFMIYPRIKGLDEFYKNVYEIVFYDFNESNELHWLIDFYLLNHAEREEIRMGGFNRAKAEHTYRHRFQQIFETLNLK